jgi:hypothetical protein
VCFSLALAWLLNLPRVVTPLLALLLLRPCCLMICAQIMGVVKPAISLRHVCQLWSPGSSV